MRSMSECDDRFLNAFACLVSIHYDAWIDDEKLYRANPSLDADTDLCNTALTWTLEN